MALTQVKTTGIADDAITTDKLANAINTERTANTAKPALANDANNRVVTGDGSGGLNGEANLTYDGSHLQLSNASQQTDSVGNFQIRYTGSESTYNSGLTTKSYSGTGQFMQWSTGGLRIGSRIITNSGIGNLYFTAGNDSVKAELGADGNLLINDGDLKIGTAGHGIDFSATSDATGKTSELLDDYEEGVWTPTLMFGGTSTGIQYADATGGSYVKIGRQVILHGRLNISNKGSSTGTASIGGFPFTSGNVTSGTSGIEGDAFFSYLHDIVSGEDHAHVMGVIDNGATQITLRWNNDQGNNEVLNQSNFEADTSVSFGVIYPTS